MKKAILVSIVSLFTLGMYAQSPVHFGIKIGANYSTLDPDVSSIESEYAVGGLGGIFVRVDLPKKFIVQTEGYYSLKRSQLSTVSSDGLGGEIKTETDIDKGDFDVVLLGGYRLVDLELFNLRLMAGVVNSINVNDNLPKGAEEFEKNSLGYQAGLGADIANITIDLRYEASFSEVQTKTKYNGFQVAVGFKFL